MQVLRKERKIINMKYIVNIKPREDLKISDIENKIKIARNSCDYIQVNFGRKGEFIKIAFCKDQTYCIRYNFWNMKFQVKTNILIKQYPKTVNGPIAIWLCNSINRLNR